MSFIDAEARGVARAVRAAALAEIERHRARAMAASLSGSLENPIARRRWLARQREAAHNLFVAVDKGQRSREVRILLAWTNVTVERARLGASSVVLYREGRRGEIQSGRALDLILSAHAQERLVRRFGLRSLDQQLVVVKNLWCHMYRSICRTMGAVAPEPGQPAHQVGVGRQYYLPVIAGDLPGPLAGLALVAYEEPMFGEVVTVLDRDQLWPAQEAILARWAAPGPPPLLDEVVAPAA